MDAHFIFLFVKARRVVYLFLFRSLIPSQLASSFWKNPIIELLTEVHTGSPMLGLGLIENGRLDAKYVSKQRYLLQMEANNLSESL